MLSGFRINPTRAPFSPAELTALPRAQQTLERALMREKFVARSVQELAGQSGLSEADVAAYCEASSHIARSPCQDARGSTYYGLLVRLLTKYSLAPDGSLVERFDSFSTPAVEPQGGVMTPSAFLSYSWDDDAHKEWVRTLAERLRADGVDVTLDRWATVPGDQLPAFMERAIRDNQFSVIVCTPRYKSRSDAREGGVGYEGDIMTAEVMTQRNNRKFIPVLRSGTWPQAAPSWLAGKYYINLSGDPYPERDYEDLVRTLLGIRETAPPIGAPMATIGANKNPKPEAPRVGGDADFEDIKITRVVVEEVTEPRNDGTRGSALYAVPFALSRQPPSEWAEMFVASWNHPPQFTTMHRPGIARIHGATVTLDGTTIQEVEQYHRDTLQLAVAEANRQYREWTHKQEQRRAREQAQREEHKKQLDDASKRIKFD